MPLTKEGAGPLVPCSKTRPHWNRRLRAVDVTAQTNTGRIEERSIQCLSPLSFCGFRSALSGGDYFDIFPISNDSNCVLIAEVSVPRFFRPCSKEPFPDVV